MTMIMKRMTKLRLSLEKFTVWPLPFWIVQRSMSMKFEMRANSAKSELIRPGFDFRDFVVEADLRPYLKVWHLLPMIDWIREHKYSLGFISSRDLERTHLHYIRCLNLQRKIEHSQLAELASAPFKFNIKVKSSLSRVGQTSFQIDHDIIHEPSDMTMFTSSIVYVCVNRSTRQVAHLPDWWVEKYAQQVEPTENPLRIDFRKLVHPDENCDHLPVTVLPSDIDYYGHTNNISYTNFAFESIINALNKQNVFKAISQRRVLENAIKEMDVDFISDSNEGDVLDAATWQDGQERGCIWTTVSHQKELVYAQRVKVDPLQLP